MGTLFLAFFPEPPRPAVSSSHTLSPFFFLLFFLLLAVLAREREEKHRRVSSEELIDHITTFFLVGYETVSGVIHFTLSALAKDLARQQKLRDELLQLGCEPTFDEIWSSEALPYLDAVVKEGYAVPFLHFSLFDSIYK